MIAEDFEIEGLKVIRPKLLEDMRGHFFEAFANDWFQENVAKVTFVQDNQSLSKKNGTIRGLHYQKEPMAQGKLVRVIRGAIFDVAVDIRPYSPSFGKWAAIELSAKNALQLWIPDGFLHGFCTLTDDCEVLYKVTRPFALEFDAGIAFDDSEIGVKWPIDLKDALLSDKDRAQPSFKTLV